MILSHFFSQFIFIDVENPTNNQHKSFSHVLQKVGVLKNFSVAKVVSKKEIEDLKQLIRAVAKDKEEYDKLFAEEMAQIANMHDPKAPVPGIIYSENTDQVLKQLKKSVKSYVDKMKAEKITKRQLCFLIASIIKELGLTQDDFLKLNEDEEKSGEETEE